MADEQIAQVQLVPQLPQQLQDLRLNGHVQRAHRFIRNEKAGPLNQRDGNAHPLALAAGQLARLRRQAFLRQLHPAQHFPHPLFAFGRIVLAENAQRLFHAPAHSVGRVQAAVRVLKNHLGPLGVMNDLPLVRLHHAQNRAGQGRFSGAGLAHQTQDLAPVHLKAHIVQHFLIFALEQQSAGVVAAGHMLQFQYQFVSHSRPPFWPWAGCGWEWPRSGGGCIPAGVPA